MKYSAFSPRLKKLLFLATTAIATVVLYKFSRPAYFNPLLIWIILIPMLLAADKLSVYGTFFYSWLVFTIKYIVILGWLPKSLAAFTGLAFPLEYFAAFGFSAYLGLVNALAFGVYRWLTLTTKISPIIIFPVVFTTIYEFFPFWIENYYAETQLSWPVTLQILDIFGAWSVLFIICMINSLLFCIITKKWLQHRLVLTAALTIIFLWLAYGFWSYPLWKAKDLDWHKVKFGVIQPNLDPYKMHSKDKGKNTYHNPEYPWELDKMIKITNNKKIDFVIWPEGNVYRYNTKENIRESFNRHVALVKTNLLFNDIYTITSEETKKLEYYNALLWIKPDGTQGIPYFKMHLTPFGEYIPFRNLLDPMLEILNYSISDFRTGDEMINFSSNNIVVIPSICYEILLSTFTAETIDHAVKTELDAKGRMILVSSADGWFGNKDQVYEHSFIGMLRAIENRTPVLHAVQNGFSSLAYASGDYKIITKYFEKDSTVIDVPVAPNSSQSFFSKYPSLFISLMRIALISIVSKPFLGKIRYITFKIRRVFAS